jgi:hypothetical protein
MVSSLRAWKSAGKAKARDMPTDFKCGATALTAPARSNNATGQASGKYRPRLMRRD